MSSIKSVLVLFSVFSFLSVKSQSDCLKLKETITIKNEQISNLNKENDYYKEALNLTKSEMQTEIENIKFQINSAVGNKQDKSIEIEGIFTNQGNTLKALQAEKLTIIDPKGNQYLSYNIVFGGKNGSIRVENIFNSIPMKFNLTLNDINDEIPIIRVLTLDIYSTINHIGSSFGKFENIDVVWK